MVPTSHALRSVALVLAALRNKSLKTASQVSGQPVTVSWVGLGWSENGVIIGMVEAA